MPIHETITTNTWFICYNAGFADIANVGVVNIGERIDSGLLTVESFATEQEYIDRCSELGIEPNNPPTP